MLYLLEHRNRLVRKQELLDNVWQDANVTENALTRSVGLLRKALNDNRQEPAFIETVPTVGYRFIAQVEVRAEQVAASHNGVDQTHSVATVPESTARPGHEGYLGTRRKWLLAAVALLLAAGAVYKFAFPPAKVLTGSDTIVLADFTNSTGDPVFDGTLRQGMAVQLEQSPFLSLISEDRIKEVLAMMDRPGDARLTPEIAREVCQRTGSTAVIDGSIASLGSQYVLGLKAVNCRTGDALAEEQATVGSKERVLNALGDAAARLRAKLGETLSSVQKFDTPLEQASTPSLEALQAFSLGRMAMAAGDWPAAVPFFERAIRLDANFAMAYARLGTSYANLGESKLGIESLRKANDLRERVSDRERFYIESHYYQIAIEDLEKARQAYELWARIYPRDWTPRIDLWVIYSDLGQNDKALGAVLESVHLDPSALGYTNLVLSYILLNRLQEARSASEEALAKQLDSSGLRFVLYRLAFLQNDPAGMAHQVAWTAGKPGVEDVLLAREADTVAYCGQLEKAREFSRRAVASAEHAGKNEAAAMYEDSAALRESLYGNGAEGRKRAEAALVLSKGRNAQVLAALALAFAGDAKRAQVLADDLGTRFPESTVVRFYYLPAIRAQLGLSRNDPFKAIETLQSAASYELGSPFGAGLYPVFVRGEAYLAAHRGVEAAAEFEKIIEQRGVVFNRATGALARLGLARAYVLQGDTDKAKKAYRDFLTLWKDADPAIPILKQAKLEYANLP